jgi:hypothetical protein
MIIYYVTNKVTVAKETTKALFGITVAMWIYTTGRYNSAPVKID